MEKKKATIEDLRNVPENMSGEIIGGELIISEEPAWKHHIAAAVLDMFSPLQSAERYAREKWVFLLKPRLELGDNILVPDLAGWKKERFPEKPDMDLISAVPDWICEILSDGTAALIKTMKMPVYAKSGLPYLWLLDPRRRTPGVESFYELDFESGRWIWKGGQFEEDVVKAAPFQEMELEFGALFQKLAVLATGRRNISKSGIVSRLTALLEAGLADRKPDDPIGTK